MDAKVLFWTGAWLNFSLLLAVVVLGIRRAKQAELASHRRAMIAASCLVLLFLVSYCVKLAVLGRENMSVWSSFDVNMLRFHETCVMVMMLAGGLALFLGRSMHGTRNMTRDRRDPAASAGRARAHRVAGRAAAVGAGLGWLTAAFVLWGMFERANEELASASGGDEESVAALLRVGSER